MIQKSKTTQQPYKNGFLYEAPQIETENIQVPLRPVENEPDSDMVNITSDITDGEPYLYTSDFGKYNHLYKDSSGNIYNYLGSKTKPYYKDQWLTPVTMSEFKQMRPKREVIGGSVEQSRVKMLQHVPNFTTEVYKKAQSYGIDPNLIFNRFAHEGFADQLIRIYNNLSYAEQKLFSEHPEYYLPLDGYSSLGLDYVGDELVNGLYDLKDSTATWQDLGTWEDNEGSGGFRSGAHAVMPDDLNSAIEMVAAALAYRQGLMKKRFNIYGQDLNYYTNAAYNMGAYNKALNNADYVKTTYSYPDYYSKYALTYSDGGSLKTGNRAAYIARLMVAAGYTAKDLDAMKAFARGGDIVSSCDVPRLQWHLDKNGNAVRGRADRGFIRRFEDGGATYNGGRMTRDNHTGTRYRKNANYFWGPADNYTAKAYRFVGLPEDSEVWTQEYDNNYSPLQVLPRISLDLLMPVLQQPETDIAK